MTAQYLNEFVYTDEELREIRALHKLNRSRTELIDPDQHEEDLASCES